MLCTNYVAWLFANIQDPVNVVGFGDGAGATLGVNMVS